MVSPGRGHRAKVKTSILHEVKPCVLVGPGVARCLVFFMADDMRSVEPERHHLGYADLWLS
jgi:hypothetical protein